MKTLKFILLVLMAIGVVTLTAQTIVPAGEVRGVWTFQNSPYLVEGDIVVRNGESLAIQPGVEVIFLNESQMVVYGVIETRPSSGDFQTNRNILFHSNPRDSWRGIILNGANDSNLHRMTIKKVLGSSALTILNSNRIVLDRIEITGNEYQPLPNNSPYNAVGLYIDGCADIQITNSHFHNNKNALRTDRPVVNILSANRLIFENNVIERNHSRQTVLNLVASGNTVTFTNNRVSHNYGEFTILRFNNNNSNPISITHNVIHANETNYNSSGITLFDGNYNITHNEITYNTTESNGGAIALEGDITQGSININKNIIASNVATLGGGIYISDISHEANNVIIKIEDNEIRRNRAENGGGIYLLGFNDGSYIKRNAIVFNEAPEGGGGGVYSTSLHPFKIINSIIAFNIGNGVSLENNYVSSVNAYNSIFWDNTGYQIANYSPQYTPLQKSEIMSCIIKGDVLGLFSAYQQAHPSEDVWEILHLYSHDPEIVDKYNFEWHRANVNRFIETHPDYEIPHYDPSKNVTDRFIGIYDYEGAKAVSKHITELDTRETFNWVSFPKLDRNPDTDDAVPSDDVFGQINITGIAVREYEFASFSYPPLYIWEPDIDGVQSTKGYKILMRQNDEIYIEGPTLNPNTWITLVPGKENWIGYFLHETLSIEVAFEPIMDYVTLIQTQHGSYVPPNQLASRPLVSSQGLTLSYGEMAVVIVDRSLQFQWGRGVTTRAVRREQVNVFAFTAGPDYFSVFVELETDNPPFEIAAVINGVVKGASVYQGTMTEILVYPDEEDFGQEIEIVFSYGMRSTPEAVNDFAVVNRRTQNLEFKPLIASTSSQYHHIKFANQNSDSSVISTPIVQLHANYPNPFNPETTINFYISQDDNIQLSVYNIRGQKVKDIYTGQLNAGKHSVSWNGTDNNNRSVASGVYFYRLSTSHGNETRRMVLMK